MRTWGNYTLTKDDFVVVSGVFLYTMFGVQSQTVTNESDWNRALAGIPYAHVLQSWAWGDIKAQHGWTPHRVVFYENGAPLAAAQILRRPLPRTPFGVLYVPKGPALDFADTNIFGRVLGELEAIARRERAIFIKSDPDVRVSQSAAQIFPQRRWLVSDEQIQFHNTVTLDLSRSEQEILDGMKPKWRYNLRLAARKGVTVERIESKDSGALQSFYEMYAETSARDGFRIRSFAYYRAVWERMQHAGEAKIFLARVGQETVAGIVLFIFGKRAWYFYGASRNTHRDLMPNHLLQWQAMQWAKAQGCTEYDFWGAPDTLDENAPMFGVYKFKMGFGGEFVERVPAQDFVVNRPLYWLYAVARPKYLARLRRTTSRAE